MVEIDLKKRTELRWVVVVVLADVVVDIAVVVITQGSVKDLVSSSPHDE